MFSQTRSSFCSRPAGLLRRGRSINLALLCRALLVLPALAVVAPAFAADTARASRAGAPTATAKGVPGSALLPFSAWVDKLLEDDPAQGREEEVLLVYYGGRFGTWTGVAETARAERQTPAHRARLWLAATKAARTDREWARASENLAEARKALETVPSSERSFDLLSEFCTESLLLRETEGLSAQFQAATDLVARADGRAEHLDRLRRLAAISLIAHDGDTFNQLASAFVKIAREWSLTEPGFGPLPAQGDLSLKAFFEDALSLGEPAVAGQIAESGISDPEMQEAMERRAVAATAAHLPEARLDEQINSTPNHRGRVAALLGTTDDDGIVFFAARGGRIETVFRLLERTRDLRFTPASYDPANGVARTRDQLPAIAWVRERWPRAVRAAATEYLRAQRPADAAALSRLFTNPRHVQPPVPESDLPDFRPAQIAFARFLAENGQPAEARRLIEALPPDYLQNLGAGSEAVRAELAQTRARLGDLAEADVLAAPLRSALLRTQTYATFVLAARERDDLSRATIAFGTAAKSFEEAAPSGETLAVYTAALAILGNAAHSWRLIDHQPGAERTDLLEKAMTLVTAGKYWGTGLAWIESASAEDKADAWHAYFSVAAPEPVVPVIKTDATPAAPADSVMPPAPAGAAAPAAAPPSAT